MTSNKTMERIMRQDSNLNPYDGFRIGGIGKVLNQIGLNQRKHHIIYKVSSGEFVITMEFTGNVMEMQLIPKEEILEELSRLREEIVVTMKWIHIGTIEVERVYRNSQNFKEFAKVMAPDPITIPRIGYKGKEKDLARVLTPQEIRVDNQYVVGRYEGMLEIAGHEFLVAVLQEEKMGVLTLGLSFLENHKPWERKEYFAAYIDSGSGICTAKPGVSLRKQGKPYLSLQEGFSQKILILNTGIREAKIMIGEHLERPGSGIKGNLEKFSCLSGNRDSSIAIASTRNLRKKSRTSGKPWNKIEATLKIKEECKYEYVRYKPIQMNMEDKKDQIIIKEHINLGLIEPGISAYSSHGFLVRNHGEIKRGILIDEADIELQEHIVEKIRNFPDVLKDKKQLQSFLGVVNFAGIFIKDLAKYRKDFGHF
ncbi:hypothetical protein Sango_1150500 [Sesamum angolense]|uniref:Uncharacterized protein n=1 Tax=Sesamum angolense TaxID=2727404 RepID=A0AAE2BWM5_9LAMI|nr:hypothetical protein Sango_1150500 [Sesamum angolense]